MGWALVSMLRVQASYKAKELEIQGKAERANTKSQLECRKSWRRVYRSPAVELEMIRSGMIISLVISFNSSIMKESIYHVKDSISLDFDFK
jgi:hypothetical protein